METRFIWLEVLITNMVTQVKSNAFRLRKEKYKKYNEYFGLDAYYLTVIIVA
jgi:hypothetical protein